MFIKYRPLLTLFILKGGSRIQHTRRSGQVTMFMPTYNVNRLINVLNRGQIKWFFQLQLKNSRVVGLNDKHPKESDFLCVYLSISRVLHVFSRVKVLQRRRTTTRYKTTFNEDLKVIRHPRLHLETWNEGKKGYPTNLRFKQIKEDMLVKVYVSLLTHLVYNQFGDFKFNRVKGKYLTTNERM